MKYLAFLTTGLILLNSGQALALPGMDITTAKSTLYNRENTLRSKAFKAKRVLDLPAFDKLGVGSYHAKYKLNSTQQLMVWMYVENAPPTVDEVTVFITPASDKDLTPSRALKLLNIVYGESLMGKQVVQDFNRAYGSRPLTPNKKSQLFRFFDYRSLLPKSYDGGLYYLGDKYGFRLSIHKGGFQVGIRPQSEMKKFLEETLKRSFPPAPEPTPVPTPEPTPPPQPPNLIW